MPEEVRVAVGDFGAGRMTAIASERFETDIPEVLGAQSPPNAAWFAGELETAKVLRRSPRSACPGH